MKIIISILILILISGCVDSNSGIQTQRPTETPVVPIYEIGDSVKDNNTKITLNNIRYDKNIDNIKAEEGSQFVIINITIENIGKDTNITYIWPQFTMIGSDAREGMPNDVNDAASAELAIPFNGEDIGPRDKRQGELAFQISENAKDLKLIFEYSPESSKGGQREIFKLNR